MAHLSKLQQEALETLGQNVNFKRGKDVAEAHAKAAGVDIKTPAFIDHVREHKDEINLKIGEVKPLMCKKPITTLDETAPTPSKTNSIELREQEKPSRGGKGKERPRSDNYVKGSHFSRGVNYERIKLNSGALLSLEPEVIKAIKILDPKMDDKGVIKSSEWCDKAVQNWAGATLNNAAIIRCSVISELLARVQP